MNLDVLVFLFVAPIVLFLIAAFMMGAGAILLVISYPLVWMFSKLFLD